MPTTVSHRTKVMLVAALVIGVASHSDARALDLQAAIDPLANKLLDDEHAVGFVVGIYQDGETQILGYGEIEKDKGVAPGGDTVYEIGSISKAFTGVLLAELVERKRVKLDDPMQKYLPKSAKDQLTNPTNITLEHLATHTSGLPRLPDNMQPADAANPYADYTFRQMFAFLKEHELRRAPGEYEYSNLGAGLLGTLLASRERKSYEELLIERIAKPCRMRDTCVTLSETQRQRLAPPYDAALQPAKNWDLPTFAGAGGIRSTTSDMLKFIAANLADDNKRLMTACQLSHTKRHTMPDGMAIGLGWHIARDGITRWHNGMTGGYASWLAVVPSHNVGVVVLSNTATMEITALGEAITRAALGAQSQPIPESPTTQVAPEVLQSYVGVYAISPQFALTITLEGDKLMVQATGQQKLQLIAESATRFVCKGVDARLFFVADDKGAIKHLVLHQNGVNQIAARQDPATGAGHHAAVAAKRAPFTGVRWEGDQPVVKIDDQWYTLVSLDGIAAADIVAFSRLTYNNIWQKRFAEDLVEVLAGMGHEPQDTVALVVSPVGSSEKRTFENVPMTKANRDAIKAAAGSAASPAVELAPEKLERYVGVYAISPQFALTVTLEGGKLMVQATGQQKFQVYPESETKFFYKVVDAQLTFSGDKNGKAERLILHQNGIDQVATRRQ